MTQYNNRRQMNNTDFILHVQHTLSKLII